VFVAPTPSKTTSSTTANKKHKLAPNADKRVVNPLGSSLARLKLIKGDSKW
jgi:hypothetical protein